MKYLTLACASVRQSCRVFLLTLPCLIVLGCVSIPADIPSTGTIETSENNQNSKTPDGVSVTDLGMQYDTLRHAKEWGVEVIGVRPSAAGYMLDFRYRVLDAEKAAELVNRKVKPYLIVEKDGSTLRVPVTSKLGPLRQSAQFAKENRNYFMFFANPNRHVKSGDLVTVVIGDFKTEHLLVN